MKTVARHADGYRLVTGNTKTYINTQVTAFQPIQDTSVFPSCP